ncbi:MAG: carboxypeptidase regulatory-like domain-containing protein [Deltaproteobacteria bacterium]|nr:carboxypeptidase regulatory-like domain-containing protein [Deltaproteobacteria bacterium]
MMRHWFSVLALLLTSSSLCHACDPHGSVSSSGQTSPQRAVVEGVQGRVTDTKERPVVGALITPTSHDVPSPAIPEIAILTDDEGHYVWHLSPGQYTLTVSADGYAPAAQRVTVTSRQTTTLNFQLEPAR